ncbi:hypothetical protein KDK_54570 [Dictyobacter kobayashii]|uniref:SHS2 domain-containing protein n=1 Tax=Dictyobacter kobayashii TaxID=2014872 RepID=A0A402ARE2_9CHLR|nr:hypothetical protein KDK_54570 [Dictyobacter kobayashii]
MGRLGQLYNDFTRLLQREPDTTTYQKEVEVDEVDEVDLPRKAELYSIVQIEDDTVRAMIIDINGNQANILGIGRQQLASNILSDNIIIDIAGATSSCNKALLEAEEIADEIIAPRAILGLNSELVKFNSITVSKQRQQPTKQITEEEVESLITAAQARSLKTAKEQISTETGRSDIDVRVTNATVTSVRIDGNQVTNPLGFRGRHFSLTLFSTFAPLAQLGAIEAVAQGLDLAPISIEAELYALARCLYPDARANSGCIFINVMSSTTEITLVRAAVVEESRIFAFGERVFGRRIATSKGISLREGRQLLKDYITGL